jgi:hypothetical protein
MNNSDRNLNNDSSNEHQEDQLSRPNPLKNRIKQRAMAMDCDDTNEVHISSVLAAASALASLGNQPASSTPPSTPENPAAAGNMRLTLEQMMAAGNSRVLPRDFDQDVPMTFPQKVSKKCYHLNRQEQTDIFSHTTILDYIADGDSFQQPTG